jgi:hypothetical protein
VTGSTQAMRTRALPAGLKNRLAGAPCAGEPTTLTENPS